MKVKFTLGFWLLITLTALATFENSNKICVSDTSKEHKFEIVLGLSTWLHKNCARSFAAVPHKLSGPLRQCPGCCYDLTTPAAQPRL